MNAETRPSRAAATGIFLVASAIPPSLLYLFLAPVMFVPICLFHIPHAIIYLIALLVVRETVFQTKKRLYWASGIAGLIMGVVDFAADVVAVSMVPELERSPFRPVIRVLVGSAICMLLSWVILRITILTSESIDKKPALNKRADDIGANVPKSEA